MESLTLESLAQDQKKIEAEIASLKEKLEKIAAARSLLKGPSISSTSMESVFKNSNLKYLKGTRDKKAYGRIELFKKFLEASGGKGNYVNFCEKINALGDKIIPRTFQIFAAAKGHQYGIKQAGKNTFELTN